MDASQLHVLQAATCTAGRPHTLQQKVYCMPVSNLRDVSGSLHRWHQLAQHVAALFVKGKHETVTMQSDMVIVTTIALVAVRLLHSHRPRMEH